MLLPLKWLSKRRRRDLPSVKQFRATLERERCRSDRTRSPVSVVSLDLLEHNDPKEMLVRVVDVLQQRLRSTDDFGLLATSRIGIVLPDTDAIGAWKVATDVCSLIDMAPQDMKCQIFEYPEDESGDQMSGTRSGGQSQPEAELPVRPLVGLFCQPLPLWKRSLDIVLATTSLIILSPLFAVVSAAIRCTSPGPIFFQQYRVGLGGRQFLLYKFRTMVDGAEAQKHELRALNEVDGPVFKIKRDPRITRLGAVLRKTSLDELPQLWNVFRGEMSLVGPRPPVFEETCAYAAWQRRRLEVTPGLTCIWQVRGRSAVRFDEWMRMDLEYIRLRSLTQDLKLLVQTVPAVLSGRGAS